MSTYIPEHLVSDIIRRVGEEDFRFLGPFIAAGPAYMQLVYTNEVMRTANLHEFFEHGEYAHEDSIYRHFLQKCFEYGNPTAKYMESLRFLTQKGPSQEAMDCLGESAEHSIFGHYAYGLLLICCGAVEDGKEMLDGFLQRVDNFAQGVMIAEHVEDEIQEMGLLGFRIFWDYFKPTQHRPVCMLYHPVDILICKHCFALTYATRLRNMC